MRTEYIRLKYYVVFWSYVLHHVTVREEQRYDSVEKFNDAITNLQNDPSVLSCRWQAIETSGWVNKN